MMARVRYVELISPTPADARHPAGLHWWPGRIHHWRDDGDGWRGFYWPEDADLSTPRLPGSHKPRDAPHGWIDLTDLRPAGHEVRVGKRQSAVMPDEVPVWWWPEADDPK